MNELPPNLARQQRALEWATALVTDAKKDAQPLEQYVRQLPGPACPVPLPGGPEVYHLLYCSQATLPFSEEQLADLLEHSLSHNARAHITGLLCYGSGHFVQVLEGEAAVVEKLFTHIARDRRHHRVHVLSRGLGPARRFADWRMAFAKAQSHEFYWLITFLEAHNHRLLLRQKPIAEPTLATSLRRFSDTCSQARQPLTRQ